MTPQSRVTSSDTVGVYVTSSDTVGVYVTSSDTVGVYVTSSDTVGVYVTSSDTIESHHLIHMHRIKDNHHHLITMRIRVLEHDFEVDLLLAVRAGLLLANDAPSSDAKLMKARRRSQGSTHVSLVEIHPHGTLTGRSLMPG